MRWWWVVDPQTLHGVKMNDAAARDAAAEGWPVVPYNNQDAGLSELGYDPNANAQHQITGDKVLVYNANTQRYEWMSRALVDAQNAATQAYGAETQRAATTADIIAASRNPANAFQYSNALHGQPDAAGVGILDALSGMLGGSTTVGTPTAENLHAPDIMGQVRAILNRSFGTGGANGSGSSAWADQAGMAPTTTEQRAQGALQDAAQTHQAGQQGAVGAAGGDPYAAARHGPNTATTPGTYISGPYDPGTPPTSVRHGPNTASTPGTYISAPYDAAPPAAAAFDPRTSPLSAFPATYGRTPTLAPDQMGSVAGMGRSGGDTSDIAWKRKYHEAISGAGFGTGSDARARANAAAGMSEAQAAHEIKHGRNPYTGIHAAQGMADVVTGPTIIHAGEGGKDELHVVIPLERADQPVPQAILHLANMLSPDKDHMRGVGNDPGHHMAAGGGLAVIGGGTTVTPANGPANAAGQVKVPYGRKTKLVPASQTTPMPDFGALPPALLSLIAPSDWKLIGSQYGAAGGNAEDIPFLLKRGTQGLGRAPGAFGGRVF